MTEVTQRLPKLDGRPMLKNPTLQGLQLRLTVWSLSLRDFGVQGLGLRVWSLGFRGLGFVVGLRF